MINGNVAQFLDTGWYSEATLYYKGHVYWCEGDTDPLAKSSHFWVNRWRAEQGDGFTYRTVEDENGDPEDFQNVLSIYGKTLDELKKQFLEAPVFEGKTFWQVEYNIAWLEEGQPIAKMKK